MSRCFDLFGRAIMRTPAAACRTAVGPRVPKQDCTSCQGTSRPNRPPSKLSRARKRLVSLTSMLAGSKPTRPAAARSVNGTAVGSRARLWCAPISGVGRASEIRGATATGCRSGSNPSAVNALGKLVELIGESTQSGAGRFGLSSAGKPPQERSVVVIAQSVFFWLLRHRSVPCYCHQPATNLTTFRAPGWVDAEALAARIRNGRCRWSACLDMN
jgi:hypothetical protein